MSINFYLSYFASAYLLLSNDPQFFSFLETMYATVDDYKALPLAQRAQCMASFAQFKAATAPAQAAPQLTASAPVPATANKAKQLTIGEAREFIKTHKSYATYSRTIPVSDQVSSTTFGEYRRLLRAIDDDPVYSDFRETKEFLAIPCGRGSVKFFCGQ